MVKKGLSPIVATLLLIVLVVALASIVFIAGRSFITEAVIKNGMPAEQACAGIVLSAVYSGGGLQITNNGDVPVSEYVVTYTTSEGDLDSNRYTEAILAGGSVSVNVPGASSIEITPIILGESDRNPNTFFECKDNVFIADIY
jgi:flagellin-like protein